jgi:hypothetical protein
MTDSPAGEGQSKDCADQKADMTRHHSMEDPTISLDGNMIEEAIVKAEK